MPSAAYALSPKSAEAFRTISEVADELGVPQHVLRFWESRFSQIRPVKRAGGRRYYRPEDVDLIKGIQVLLHREGFTIKGVQKVLKERGARHVAEVGRKGATIPAAAEPVVIEKIVYVPQKAPPKKRPTHLRAVPLAEMTLPFFDLPEPASPETPAPLEEIAASAPEVPDVADAPVPVEDSAEEPFIEQAAPQIAGFADESDEAPVDAPSRPADEERARLQELLNELTGLKARLAAARAGRQVVR